MEIVKYFSMFILFINYSFGFEFSSSPYYHHSKSTDILYRVLAFNNLLKEIRHCYISLTVHLRVRLRVQLEQIHVPLSLYYTHSYLQNIKHPGQYSMEFVGQRNRKCRATMLITMETEFIVPDVIKGRDEFGRTTTWLRTRGFVMCGINPL